ncbi:MAG TPA: ABC transporter ATP-binding protein [Accumulibacter sp.]|uniref:Sulfate/thiosulfate import ATP-binding protein CysA n=2 Tax=Candidatus Accumulibacter TaxID=327159 RepID=A0A080M9S2_9PROT|nr:MULTISPECIES: ABC transporter ATP-binding protein [Candidatus Accumulibacter]KFB77726.1 MAG: Sulfate/thiosulfate import ATP-binding protein CysA [Candidatus Accumulibacter cognatus]MBL8401952.1 ABC transporter ATP-binding protein [Accumulibacter sp.]MBN8517403.1 ABC transporter ATP-binding protein [Accumulibacter sp.]MBO3710663.1 ABC transporter ATP-binding protein [Accumulibacter sp.]MCC2869844.1 ABC transporter ATP-binding protein [Candidatus Accumulibacter phosphatis]
MTLSVQLRHGGPPLDFAADFPDGRITALVGPSGSGKTSILRAIAGLLPVRQAHVALGTEIWAEGNIHRPTRERSIGFVSQHYGLFPHLTVQANVETALIHLPIGERRKRALHCLALAHVEGLERRYPDELSGGQKQRVALARAIARQPQVLLLDEPFSAVDRSTRKRLYIELLRLHEQLAATVLLVTHDLDEAAQLASHLLLLRHGRIVQSGATSEVLTRPTSEEAARLLDIPNIFTARVDGTASGRNLRLRWGPHALRATGPLPAGIEGDLRWAILPSNVLLVRPDKPWGSHLENPLLVIVEEVIEMGTEAVVRLQPQGLSEARLQMRLPVRAVHRYGIAVGREVTVSLRAGDIVPLHTGPAR